MQFKAHTDNHSFIDNNKKKKEMYKYYPILFWKSYNNIPTVSNFPKLPIYRYYTARIIIMITVNRW